MSEKSRNWINRHESWWNESINKEVAFHDLERILDDYERELRLSNVVVPKRKFYCHDKTGGDCNSLNIKQCKECLEIEKRQ